jgi:nicotinamidase/pyrazinamidase
MQRYDQVFVDIDTQFDFMDPAGKLYVPQAQSIIPVLQTLFDYARRTGTPVISSADSHFPDDPEFAQFPPHCMVGTPGQAKLPQTLLPAHRVLAPDDHPADLPALLRKHQQLVFTKHTFDLFSNANAVALVESITPGRYVLFGVATDYCVRAAALALLARRCPVVLVRDAVKAVSADTEAAALAQLQAAGARWSQSRRIVE